MKVLEYVGDAAVGMLDLTAAFLSAGYGASASKILHEFDKKDRERSQKCVDHLEIKRQKQRFSTILCRLKNDGLIEEKADDSKSYIKLTTKGKRHFEALKKRRLEALPDTFYDKHNPKDGKFMIVAFDIPERERRKRVWLRSALKNIGFNLIQKSVWAGKVKIPQQFLDDLKDLRLVEYVEIFEISKTGSLRQLT